MPEATSKSPSKSIDDAKAQAKHVASLPATNAPGQWHPKPCAAKTPAQKSTKRPADYFLG
jgi:hypothetical protein